MRMCMLYVTYIGFPYWLFRLWYSLYEGVFGSRCTSVHSAAFCPMLPLRPSVYLSLSTAKTVRPIDTVGAYRKSPLGMLSSRGQRGLEAKIFGLGLVTSGLVQCCPSSHEHCPRGLVDSHWNHVLTLRSSLIGNCCLLYNILFKLTVEQAAHWHWLWLPYWVWFLGIDKFYVGALAFISFLYGVSSRPY